MIGGASSIRDARGREIVQLDPWRMHLLPGRGAIEGRDLERITAEIAPDRGRSRRLCVVMLGVGVMGLGGVAATMLSSRAAWDGLVRAVTHPAIIIPNLAWIAYVPVLIIQERRRRRHRVTAVLLKHRRCPQCGYSLIGLPVDPADGATVCPECAAAWRLDDPLIERRCASCALAPGTCSGTRWAITILGLTFLAGLAIWLIARG